MKQKAKLYLLFFILILPIITFSNENFRLNGYLNESFNGFNVNLYIDRDTASKVLSTTVIDGRFYFEISPTSLYEHCILSLTKDTIYHTLEFFASKEDIEIKLAGSKTISLKENPFKRSRFQGVFFTNFIEGYRSSLEIEVTNLFKISGSRAFRHSSNTIKDSINNLLEQKKDELFEYRLKFIKSQTSSYPALFFFKENILRSSTIKADSIASLFSKFSVQLQQTELGKQVSERIKKKMSVMIDKEAPEIDVVDLNDSTYKLKLKNVRGKYTLLCFWTSWCKPCIKNIPTLKEFDSLYASSGLKLISVSVDREKSDWITSVGKYNMRWLQVLNPSNSKASVIYAYVYGVPQYYLLDETGTIIYNNEQFGDDDDCRKLKDKLKKMFKKSPEKSRRRT